MSQSGSNGNGNFFATTANTNTPANTGGTSNSFAGSSNRTAGENVQSFNPRSFSGGTPPTSPNSGGPGLNPNRNATGTGQGGGAGNPFANNNTGVTGRPIGMSGVAPANQNDFNARPSSGNTGKWLFAGAAVLGVALIGFGVIARSGKTETAAAAAPTAPVQNYFTQQQQMMQQAMDMAKQAQQMQKERMDQMRHAMEDAENGERMPGSGD